jgi:ribonuclease-3
MSAVDDLESLEQALGLRFGDRSLLRQALVHSSYVNEHPEAAIGSNQRLEFLGDALLDFVVAEEVYRRYAQMSEGELTALRAALVCGDTLARIAISLDLGRYLVLGLGEESSGGRSRPSNLAAAFEALVGAILLDQGYGAARQFVLCTLEREESRLSQVGVPKDPKSQLQELVQGQGRPSPVYRLAGELGPDHAKQFVVDVLVGEETLGTGIGPRKSEAERQAAQQALLRLRTGHGTRGPL